MSQTFYSVEAAAGAGKTHGVVEHCWEQIVQGADPSAKFIIAANSVKLQREIHTRMVKRGVQSTLFYSRAGGQIVSTIDQHIEQALPDQGQVIVISHVALKRLTGRNRKFWHLIVDEIPSGFEHIPLKIGTTHNIITDHLDASHDLAPGLGISVIQSSNAPAIQKLMANENKDDLIKTFQPLLHAIESPDNIVCVDTEKYGELLSNPTALGHMDFYSLLKDDFVHGFKSVTFMGANASETSLYVLWSKLMDVTWQKHHAISKHLQYEKHNNGSRLKIVYLFDRNWSGKHGNKPHEDGTVIDAVVEFAERYFDKQQYLWHANADASRDMMSSRWQLPTVSNGIDRKEYRETHNVVLLSALNHHSPTYAFLEKLGIDTDTAQAMISYQTEYQAMMRSSLRDPDAIAPVTVLVMSKGSAEWLAERFPGCVVEKLDAGLPEPGKRGRPAKENKLADWENAKNTRERRKAERLADQGIIYVPQIIKR